MVKHWFILLMLGAWDAYYVHDWYVLRKGYEVSGDRKRLNCTIMHTTSYSIDGTEFANAKARNHSQRST
jgi:hypothetical protein